MSFQFGSSQQKQRGGGTQTIQLPAPGPGQQELERLSIELAQEQLKSLRGIVAEQQAFATSPEAEKQRRVLELATEQILARLEGRAPVLSPAAEQRIGTAFPTAERRGQESIRRFGEEAAGARGMRLTDSPIGAEALRQSRELTEGLGAARAGAELDVGQTEALFAQSLRDFQNRLQQQALMNRLAMSATAPAAFGLQQQLFAQRIAASPRTFSQFGNLSGSQWQAGISATDVGRLAMGAGALGV